MNRLPLYRFALLLLTTSLVAVSVGYWHERCQLRATRATLDRWEKMGRKLELDATFNHGFNVVRKDYPQNAKYWSPGFVDFMFCSPSSVEKSVDAERDSWKALLEQSEQQLKNETERTNNLKARLQKIENGVTVPVGMLTQKQRAYLIGSGVSDLGEDCKAVAIYGPPVGGSR